MEDRRSAGIESPAPHVSLFRNAKPLQWANLRRDPIGKFVIGGRRQLVVHSDRLVLELESKQLQDRMAELDSFVGSDFKRNLHITICRVDPAFELEGLVPFEKPISLSCELFQEYEVRPQKIAA